jgi:hypothetical protein
LVSENSAVSRAGTPQVVIKQDIPVSQAEFSTIRQAHEAAGINRPMNNVLYGFPGKTPCTFNCATYPEQIGIQIPEPSGNMRIYMPLLEGLGEVWKP